MEIGRRYNQFTFDAYCYYIDQAKKCMDFNIVGLYRGILDNQQLHLEERIALRNHARQKFGQAFECLQVRDPETFIKLLTLGRTLTTTEEEQLWQEVERNRKIILHRQRQNGKFGRYAQHLCGDENCVWHGLLIKQDSWAMAQ